MSQRITFLWDDNQSDVHYRLYEDGEMAIDNIGELKFDLLMDGKEYKDYVYHVTAVKSQYGIESEPSNTVTVNFTQPAAPTNLRLESV